MTPIVELLLTTSSYQEQIYLLLLKPVKQANSLFMPPCKEPRNVAMFFLHALLWNH